MPSPDIFASPRLSFLTRTPSKTDLPTSVPALLSLGELNKKEALLEERIRTLSLAICALAVCFTAAWVLKDVLAPFVMAMALKYLLMPLIDLLACADLTDGQCSWKLPRCAAIMLTVLIACTALSGLCAVLLLSIREWTDNLNSYEARLKDFYKIALHYLNYFGVDADTLAQSLQSDLGVSGIVMSLLGKSAHVAKSTVFVLLFFIFMLVGHESEPQPQTVFDERVKAQIYGYIRGKVLVSGTVAGINAMIYLLLGIKLWFVFGIVTFWLNFVPTIGTLIAVLLPMPLVALDSQVPIWKGFAALFFPGGVAIFLKETLEPYLLSASTSLQPVAVIFAVMLGGTVWGATGMVLAVPMTAVARIYLENIDHPMTRYLAIAMAGANHPSKIRNRRDNGSPKSKSMVHLPQKAINMPPEETDML